MSLWLLSCVPLVMEGTSCLSPQQPHAWLQRTAVTGWMSLGPHPPHTHGSQTHLQLGPSYLQVNNHNILNLRYVYLPSGSCAFMDNKLLFIVNSKTSACFRGVNLISLLGWGGQCHHVVAKATNSTCIWRAQCKKNKCMDFVLIFQVAQNLQIKCVIDAAFHMLMSHCAH